MWTILMIALGYCVAVLFPVPYLSEKIINGWKTVITGIKDYFNKR